MNFNEKIIVGMSGGVDSSISAIILKDMGFNIKGLFMKNWEEDDHDGNCNGHNDFDSYSDGQSHLMYFSVMVNQICYRNSNNVGETTNTNRFETPTL